jgi:hypothetical protein
MVREHARLNQEKSIRVRQKMVENATVEERRLAQRRGEKIGWIGGWSGGFVWLVILTGVWIARGQYAPGVAGVVLLGLVAAAVLFFAPWRRPRTPYRLLLIPLYVMLFAAMSLAVFVTGIERLGLTWWSFSWLPLLFLPVITVGRRRWVDGEENRVDG